LTSKSTAHAASLSSEKKFAQAATAENTFSVPSFIECETDFTTADPTSIFKLKGPVKFKVSNLYPKLKIKYTPGLGLESFVVYATPTFNLDLGLSVTAALEGKLTCEQELGSIPVPVGGLLSFLVSGQVPVGYGIELGGKLTVADVSLGFQNISSATAEIGINCPDGTDCQLVKTLDIKNESKFDLTPPLVLNNAKLEPTLHGYGYLKAYRYTQVSITRNSLVNLTPAAKSMTRCMPSQIVLTPGSPSPLRAKKPPSRATKRITSLSRGGV